MKKQSEKCKRPMERYLHIKAGILSEIRSFYTDLFTSRDHLLSDIDLHEHFKNENINKPDENESLNLGKLLTVDERGYTLKNMKN